MSSETRRWLEVRARDAASPLAGDLLADALVGLGARAVEERGAAFVAYFEEPDDPEAFLAELAERLASSPGLEDVRLEQGWQDHEEWAETWRRGLTERRLTDRVVVRPTWVRPGEARPGDIVIEIDPGMAFGTAEHGTTRGCLRLLDGLVEPGQHVVDVGAGSGILAIAMARMGAAAVTAIEGDAFACEALAENLEHNGVQDRVSVVPAFATATSLAAHGPVDGVVANIEAGLLEPLFDGFERLLEEGGWLVVSGILAEEWETVREGLEARDFDFERVDAEGEWRSGQFARSG